MKKLIIYFLILVMLVGCGGSSVPDSFDSGEECNRIGMGICRLIDTEAKVVCYIYNARGISCVPQNQTALP
jgi:hypothetical protein